MKSSLIVGDIHTKYWIIDSIFEYKMGSGEVYAGQFDKIIFLGDYVDDWNASPEASYRTVKKLVELKKKYPEQIVLLVGNHCLGSAFAGKFRCSGFNPETHSLVRDLYTNNDKLFDVAYWDGDFLYSHAGFTNSWVKELELSQDPEELADGVNSAFHNRLKDKRSYQIFSLLGQAGSSRGGMGNPSPLWADKRELEANPLPFVNQIVGHTPVKTATRHEFKNGDGSKNELWFCDTFSTWYEPWTGLVLPIGDSTLLELDFGKTGKPRKKIIKLSDLRSVDES